MNTDKEVAEKVMGWLVSTATPNPKSQKVWVSGVFCNEVKYLYYEWTPFTDSKYALEVEAEMFSRGYSLELRHGQNERDRRYEWYAVFLKAGHRYYAFGATLEEAICLAALRAPK